MMRYHAVKMIMILMLLINTTGIVWAQDSNPANDNVPRFSETIQSFPRHFLDHITLVQFKLRQHMAELVRGYKKEGRITPLLILMAIAFAYGAVHAAGPGHGKAIAVSFVMSHRSSVMKGLALSLCIAIVHGFAGVVGVLGLRYIIQSSFNESLAYVTFVTQVASYSLIVILGLYLVVHHVRAKQKNESHAATPESQRGVMPWILAAGLVPCPAVVMVMLFCLSQNVVILGLLLTVCIQLGMAATISLIVAAAAIGKYKVFCLTGEIHTYKIESYLGIGAGITTTFLGVLFLTAMLFEKYH